MRFPSICSRRHATSGRRKPAKGQFFKHADDDPDDTLEFRPEVTAFHILDAILIYPKVIGPIDYGMWLFLVWFSVRHPGLLLWPSKDGVAGESILSLFPVPWDMEAWNDLLGSKEARALFERHQAVQGASDSIS